MTVSYIHPALYKKRVRNKGWGLFTKTALKKGELIGASGGVILNEATILKREKRGNDYGQQIHEKGFYLTPRRIADLGTTDFLNHSCEPNVWLVGDLCIEVSRDIQPHEELTIEYATLTNDRYYSFNCRCESTNCRGVVTGNDWKNLELQKRYFGHFAPYLQRMIETQLQERHLAISNGQLYFVDDLDETCRHNHKVTAILAERHSSYQHIQIFLTPHGPMLVLDGYPQISYRDWIEYTEALVGPAILLHPDPKKILVLGGGDGACTTILLKDRRVKEVILVDIDDTVIKLTKKHMPKLWGESHRDPRLTIVTDVDALDYLRTSGLQLDVVISDLTDPEPDTASSHLLGNEYFKNIRKHLKTDGIFVTQAGELTKESFEGHRETLKLMTQNNLRHPVSYSLFIPSFSTAWSFLITTGDQVYNPPLSSWIADWVFKIRAEISRQFLYLNPDSFSNLFNLDHLSNRKSEIKQKLRS